MLKMQLLNSLIMQRKVYSWLFNLLADSHPEIHKQIESVYPKKSIIICRLSGRNAQRCNTHFVWRLSSNIVILEGGKCSADYSAITESSESSFSVSVISSLVCSTGFSTSVLFLMYN